MLEKRNEEIILQRNELERLSEINEAANLEKMEFFTNIPHEFKKLDQFKKCTRRR